MKRLLLLVILSFALDSTARVDETHQQCTERYGPQDHGPLSRLDGLASGPGSTNALYRYQGWNIRIGFIDGVARVVDYQKAHKQGQQREITDAEFQGILDAYQKSPWKKAKSGVTINPISALETMITKTANGDSWTSDHGLTAYRRPGGTIVRVVDQSAMDRQKERIESEKQRNALPVPKF